jgi:glycosyltransferase involved in cell wall biosynthesis
MDLIVEAFKSIGQRLVVIGDGSMLTALKRIAGARSNIEFLGHCDATTVAQVVAGAKAFVFASREDFGIAPLEAQATGCPVIAYGKGGASETIVGWPASGATGVFFDTQTPEALKAAVELFEVHETRFAPKASLRNAERFGQQRFQREFQGILEELWERFQKQAGWDTLLWREDLAE